jgi:hypothetical protein
MSLKQLFVNNQVGNVPTFFSLEIEKEELIDLALESIDKVLTDLNINPRFPFPLYIICSKRNHFKNLNLIQDKNQLPSHFKKKPQKLKTKEMGLLAKTEISSSRIKNLDIKKKMELLKDLSDGQRLLSELTRESYFYQQVLSKLKKENKEHS